ACAAGPAGAAEAPGAEGRSDVASPRRRSTCSPPLPGVTSASTEPDGAEYAQVSAVPAATCSSTAAGAISRIGEAIRASVGGSRVRARLPPYCRRGAGCPVVSRSASAPRSKSSWISLSSLATVISIERADEAHGRPVDQPGRRTGHEAEEASGTVEEVECARAGGGQLVRNAAAVLAGAYPHVHLGMNRHAGPVRVLARQVLRGAGNDGHLILREEGHAALRYRHDKERLRPVEQLDRRLGPVPMRHERLQMELPDDDFTARQQHRGRH